LEARGMHASIQCIESTSWQVPDGSPCGCITHLHHTQNPYLTQNAIVKIMQWKLVFWKKKKFVRNDFRIPANLYFCPCHSTSISSLIPKNMMDPQFGGPLK